MNMDIRVRPGRIPTSRDETGRRLLIECDNKNKGLRCKCEKIVRSVAGSNVGLEQGWGTGRSLTAVGLSFE